MTDIVEHQQGAVTAAQHDASPFARMLAAQQAGIGLDQIREMMNLQVQWEQREAEKTYNVAFAAFKAEAVTVLKGRTVTDGPLKGRSYAELHDVVDAVTPALSRHGLSASWKVTKDDRDWIEVTCTLKHVGGHAESVSMGGPPDTGGAKNALQARASTKTYLERYTLKAICGVAEGGDDDDGNGGNVKDWSDRAMEAETAADLETVFRAGRKAFEKARDPEGFRTFSALCARLGDGLRKKEAGNG